MIIKIDYREKELITECNKIDNPNIKLVVENLPLGDMIISKDNQDEIIIIERKSLNDLASSIRDGRYNEQSFRLSGSTIHNHSIYYVIEGDLANYNSYKTRVDKKALISAMASLSYFKGFSVHRTNNIKETAEWLIQFTDKLCREDKPSYYSQDDTKCKYSEVAKKVKKENITPENIGEIMLSQIPGVSITVAIKIMEQYKTIRNLIKCLEEDQNVLNKIELEGKTGKTRKINKTTVANIYMYLVKNTEIEVVT